MSSEYLPTIRYSFCLLLVTVLYVCLTAGLPEDEAKRSNPVYSFLRSQRLRPKEMFGPCGIEDEPCIPGTDQCCDGYQCRNKFAHVCLYPLEACFCTSPILGYVKANADILANLRLLQASVPVVSIKILVSVDNGKGNCSDNGGKTLIGVVKELTQPLLDNGRCINLTKGIKPQCSGDTRPLQSTRVSILQFGIIKPNFSCFDFLQLNSSLRNERIQKYKETHRTSDEGFICGWPECPSVLPNCKECKQDLESERSKPGDHGIDAAALGGGIGGGLAALAGLLAVAAAAYRRWRKNKVDDVSSNAAAGATPVVNIDEATNSIPPAGTS